MILNDSERREALGLARRAVEAWVREARVVSPQSGFSFSGAWAGAFVTLTLEDRLRGCIGVVEPTAPLPETLIRCAIAAASQDSRFPPVEPLELPRIRHEISVLSRPNEIASADPIEVGCHGLIVESRGRKGLLLPQVAEKAGWSREQFLEQVCRKAGLPPGTWRQDARLWTFTADVFGEEPPG